MPKSRMSVPTVQKEGLFADIKSDLVAMVGEFVGTVLFLLFALGTAQTANIALAQGTNAGDAAAVIMFSYYICAGFGLSLIATAFVFYRFTGSIFNPSVGLALMLCGVIKPVRFVLVSVAEMLGGIVAAAILDALIPGPSMVGVGLGPGVSRTRGLFIEMFTTAMLTLSVLMLAAEKHTITPFAPMFFGFTLFVVMMMSLQFTGGAVNTARAFGPACIEGFQTYHWIYWLGPGLGAIVAAAFYRFLKQIKYWRVNPGQDSTDVRESAMTEV